MSPLSEVCWTRDGAVEFEGRPWLIGIKRQPFWANCSVLGVTRGEFVYILFRVLFILCHAILILPFHIISNRDIFFLRFIYFFLVLTRFVTCWARRLTRSSGPVAVADAISRWKSGPSSHCSPLAVFHTLVWRLPKKLARIHFFC